MSANDIVLSSAGVGGAAPADDNFKNVSLLLSGDGTNGAQNNTFLDSSTNNFTITRNGNTTQGSFSPYGSLWSNVFSASSTSFLSAASNSAFAFGTGDFTMEAWVFASQSQTDNWITACADASNANCWFRVGSTGALEFYNNVAGSAVTGSTALPTNQWVHAAVVRSGTTLTIYQNGTSIASATVSTNFSTSVGCTVGGQFSFDRRWYGYISNVRIVKGTAVYTSAFTPSTTPLTAISGTSILTCQSNRFIDNSSNAFALTVNGTPSVQRFSPFNPTAPYDTATIGGSGYFDGSGDYLTLPSSSNLAFGTGDFSVEAFVYTTSMASNANVISNTTSTDTQFGLLWLANGTLRLAGWNTAFLVSASGVIKANQWQHVVCCRTGTTASLFADGVRVATGTVSNNFSSTDAFNIGRNPTPFDNLVGYMSNLRVLKGSSAYDPTATTITVPTAPVTAITNTQLLTNFTNAGIPDLAMQNDLETVGNAQVSTSVKKYGTGSLAFDGTGDWLNMPISSVNTLGSGSFTIEAWVYPTSIASNKAIFTMEPIASTGFEFFLASGALAWYSGGGVVVVAGSSVTVNTWTHVAAVRNGTTLTLYVNGTSVGSATNTTNYTQTSAWVGHDSSNQDFIGYIDDLRITKGLARYTATFTPPTAALPTY